MIRYGCPRCRAVLQASDQMGGTKVACPRCGQRLMVPTPPSSPQRTVLTQKRQMETVVRSG